MYGEKTIQTFSFVSLSLYVRIFDEYRWKHGVCIDSAVRRGSRKEAGKLVRGKSTFRIWESSSRKLAAEIIGCAKEQR